MIEDNTSNHLQQIEQNRETQQRINAQQQCIDNLNTMITPLLNNQNLQQLTPTKDQGKNHIIIKIIIQQAIIHNRINHQYNIIHLAMIYSCRVTMI
jgi:hypothetical protein